MENPQPNFPAEDEPIFNIGAVTRMTGIPEATLRIWERRYDFPLSTRTPGGHRLYSQHEIARLQWVKQRIDQGLQISQAIHALEILERDQAATLPAGWRPEIASEPSTASAEMFAQQLGEALFRHDTDHADQVLADALPVLELDALVLDVVGLTLHAIGDAWAEGRIGAATEHFASHYLRARLVMWLRAGPPAFRANPVVLACAPGELHEGGLLMLGVLLRRLRWPVHYLGQTMPLEELPAFVEDVTPAVIVFAAMREDTARALAAWPDYLPQAARTGRPVVAYGGWVFSENPALADEIPGVLLGDTLRKSVGTLDRMLRERNPLLP